jgi:hypothetical protein
MIIIGLTGPARSGKTTVARYLNSLYDFQEIAFADPLKNALCKMLNISRDVFDTQFAGSAKELPLQPFGKSVREMLQTLGTDWARNMIHPDFWVMAARGRLDHIEQTLGRLTPGIVISDVRFENEAAMIRERGGHLLRIHRNDCQAVREHSSETGIAEWPTDIHIDNNGDLKHLKVQIDALVANFTHQQKGIA